MNTLLTSTVSSLTILSENTQRGCEIKSIEQSSHTVCSYVSTVETQPRKKFTVFVGKESDGFVKHATTPVIVHN